MVYDVESERDFEIKMYNRLRDRRLLPQYHHSRLSYNQCHKSVKRHFTDHTDTERSPGHSPMTALNLSNVARRIISTFGSHFKDIRRTKNCYTFQGQMGLID